MSRRRKLEKFADLKKYDHVYEMTEPGSSVLCQNLSTQLEMQGRWSDHAFKNDNPLCLELACGRGEYTIGLARKNSNTNYLGVDIKGARIWQGAQIVMQEQLRNAAFLRVRIEQLEYFFNEGEIDHLWITFPDPFPAKENRRLTCPKMMDKYHGLIKPGGKIHFKTDDEELFDYSLEIARKSPKYDLDYYNFDIYASALHTDDLKLKTYYERQHLDKGKKIKYLEIIRK